MSADLVMRVSVIHGFEEKTSSLCSWLLKMAMQLNDARKQRTGERQRSKKDSEVEQEDLLVRDRPDNGYGCLRFFFFCFFVRRFGPGWASRESVF